MNKYLKFLAVTALLSGVLASPATAQNQPIELTGDVQLVKIVSDEGGERKTTLVDPDIAVPGDRLIFGTAYANHGTEAVADLVVASPLPKAVQLAPDADPALVLSVDGGRHWGVLSDLSVTNADGSARAAQATDVTHVRWTLALVEPGASGRLEYPAIIR